MHLEDLKCIKVACTNNSSFAVTDRGKVLYTCRDTINTCSVCFILKVFSWGYNSNGELGIGNTSTQTTPKEVTLKDVVTKVNVIYRHMYVIMPYINMVFQGVPR